MMSPTSPRKKMKTHHNDDVKAVKDQNINILDYDSLAAIFMYLPFQERLGMENVCEKWNTACERAWCDIKSFNSADTEFIEKHFKKSEQFQDQIEKLLDRCGIYIKELSLNKNYNSNIIQIIREKCHNLLKLELEITDDNDESFEDVFSNMKNLESIKIIHKNDNDFSSEYKNVLKSLPETIENIYYDCGNGDYPDVTADVALTLIKFNQLNCLVLRKWTLDDALIDTLCQKNSITQLSLENSYICQSHLPILKLTNLVALNVADIRGNGLCDEDMIDIINNCDKIQYLNLRHSNRLTLLSLNRLDCLKSLEKLVLDHTAAKDSVFGVFPKLQRLDCVNCKLTDAGIISVLKNSPRLEKLDICRTDITIKTIEYASNISKSRGIKLNLYIDKLFSLENGELIDEYRSEFLSIEVASEIYMPFWHILFRFLDEQLEVYNEVGSSDSDDDDDDDDNEDEDEDDDDDNEDDEDEDNDNEDDDDDEEDDDKRVRDNNGELNYDGDEDDNENSHDNESDEDL